MPEIQVNPYELKKILNVIFKRKKQVFIFLGGTLTIFMALSLWLTPQYEATAQLLVTLGKDGLLFPTFGDQAPQVIIEQDNFMNSEAEIIKSASNARKVIESLGGAKAVFQEIANGHKDAESTDAAYADVLQEAVMAFQKKLTVQVVKKSNLINLSFRHPDPDLAAEIVNRLIAFYIDHRLNIRKTKKSYGFFQSQAEVLDTKLKASERDLEALKAQFHIYSLDDQKTILLRQKSELQAMLNQTISSDTEIGARAADLRRKIETIPKTISQTKLDDYNDLAINTLQSRLVELELQEKKLAEKYTDENRSLQGVRDEIAYVRRKLSEQENRQYVKSTSGSNPLYQGLQQDLIRLDAERRALSGKRNILTTQIADFEKQLWELSNIEHRYKQLLNQASTDRRNFELYQQKVEEFRISDAMDTQKISNVNVVEPASRPLKPVSPRLGLNAILGLVFGISGALALVFLLEYVSDRMENPEDVEESLDLPVLTSIPSLHKR